MTLLTDLLERQILSGPDADGRYTCRCGSRIKANSVSGHIKTYTHSSGVNMSADDSQVRLLFDMKKCIDRSDTSGFMVIINAYVSSGYKTLSDRTFNNVYSYAVERREWNFIRELLLVRREFTEDRRHNDLVLACQHEDEDVVELLLSRHQADVKYRAETPIRWAIFRKNVSLITLLISSGASLQRALGFQKFSVGHLLFLIDNGFSCEYLDEIKNTTIENASNERLEYMLKEAYKTDNLAKQIKILRRLISLEVAECSICMTLQDAHYKCTTCPHSICTTCRDSLTVKKCPYCRSVW